MVAGLFIRGLTHIARVIHFISVMAHDIRWYSPAPLWSKHLENGSSDRLTRPELLRFATDDFMEVLQEELQSGATTFADYRAGTETNRTEHTTDSSSKPIPLYQPVHERYYLVTSSLICRERGLPDRTVDTTNDESASFVLRRYVQEESEEGEPETREYGWFGDEWRPVGDNFRHVPEGEERLPMFPQTYTHDTLLDGGKGTRRLWAGLIPVAKRETYETAPIQHSEDGEERPVPRDDVAGDATPLSDSRKTRLATRVIGAFSHLKNRIDPDSEEQSSSLSAADVRDPLLFAWLDLWQFLDEHLPEVAEQIRNPDDRSSLDADERAVLETLDRINVSALNLGMRTSGETAESATAALRVIAANASDIEAGKLDQVLKPGDLPSKNDSKTLAFEEISGALAEFFSTETTTPNVQRDINEALDPLEDAEQLSEALQPPVTESGEAGSSAVEAGWTYVVRCVYDRPHCPPSRRKEVSEPSRPFRMASFFDAEAPAREMSITLPGASVAELRNSSQSVTMHFTKELRKQAQRVQDLSLDALDNGEIGSAPGVNIGMICSLSIPIITICALILLLIIVTVLNIVFWWLPFFKICFPLPTGD